MGRLARICTTIVVSCGLAAALWMGLQFGAGYDPGMASAVGVGLAALLGTVGAAWVQLTDDPAVDASNVSLPGTGTLKGVTRIFADRAEELADLKAIVHRTKHRKGTRAAVMVYGMPGVGKTAFALYAAHELVDEFNQYARRRHLKMLPRLIELHGLEGLRRRDPRDALRELLDIDGPDPRRAAMNLDDLAAEWRKHLQGKFLVLVLDNAHEEDQVIPFLPGGSSFILLITGRRMLEGLIADGVAPYRLRVLSEDGAIQMINNIVVRPRTSGDRRAISGIAQLCGYQPLAITIAVSVLAAKPGVSFASRLAQMNGHASQLLAVGEYADQGNGGNGVVRSFDLSYTQLPDAAKLVLRRLACVPVPTVTVEAAAALADLPGNVIAASLRELAEESLIEEDEIGETFQMHDLVRRYGRSLAAQDDPAETTAAINRLLAYYRDAAASADALLTRQPTPSAIDPSVLSSVRHDFRSRLGVIEWVRAELPNLLACADYVIQNSEGNARREENAWTLLFASALAGILRNEGYWSRSIEFQTHAINCAEKIHLPLGMANALSERGMLYRLTADLESAVRDLERAISIYRTVGGRAGLIGEAHALNTYGVVLDQLDKRDEGRRRLSEALDIYRGSHDSLGEANILHDQGMAEFFAGDYDEAIRLLKKALELYKAVDQPLGMAHAHSNLARAQQQAGAGRSSVDNLQSARVLYRELGNKLGEINVLVRLGATLRQQDRERAVQVLNEAITLSADIGNQLAQLDALDELGEIYMGDDDRKAAHETWSRALRIAREHEVLREVVKLEGKVRRAR